nr:MAG TPA: hypothetical protein [Caudoviricetes sp.]
MQLMRITWCNSCASLDWMIPSLWQPYGYLMAT